MFMECETAKAARLWSIKTCREGDPKSVTTAASLATSRRTAGSASGKSKAPTTDLKASGLKARAGEGHKATWHVRRPWKDKARHGCLIREHPPTSLRARQE